MHETGGLFAHAGRQETVDEVLAKAGSDDGEHGCEQEYDEGSGKGSGAVDSYLLDIADETGAGCQPGEFGQVDEDESEHDDTVKNSFDDDGGKGCGDGDSFAAFEDDGAQDFTGPGGVDVVAHVSDCCDGEHGARRDGFDGFEEVVPAPGADPDADEIEGNAGDDPPVVGAADDAPKFSETQTAQGNPDKENRNDYAEPELPFFHSR